MKRFIPIFLIVLSLSSCHKLRPKPQVPIPNAWKDPLKHGLYSEIKDYLSECDFFGCKISHDGLKDIMKNQAQCDVIRLSLIDIIESN